MSVKSTTDSSRTGYLRCHFGSSPPCPTTPGSRQVSFTGEVHQTTLLVHDRVHPPGPPSPPPATRWSGVTKTLVWGEDRRLASSGCSGFVYDDRLAPVS